MSRRDGRLGSTNTPLAKSARLLRDTLQAQGRRNVKAPDGEHLREQMARYNKYSDRPLPPVRQRKGRLNFGPGRSELLERLNEIPAISAELNSK